MKYKNKPMLSCAKLCTTFGSYLLFIIFSKLFDFELEKVSKAQLGWRSLNLNPIQTEIC